VPVSLVLSVRLTPGYVSFCSRTENPAIVEKVLVGNWRTIFACVQPALMRCVASTKRRVPGVVSLFMHLQRTVFDKAPRPHHKTGSILVAIILANSHFNRRTHGGINTDPSRTKCDNALRRFRFSRIAKRRQLVVLYVVSTKRGARKRESVSR
jgi:hypothetical protein